jgi:hypothetical protein
MTMSDERLDLAIDRAIDEVARQMTEGQPPADFRAGIVARLDAGDRPRRFWPAAWVLSPVAVAAAIVLAIFVARGFQPRERGPERAALQPSPHSAVTQARPPVESERRTSASEPARRRARQRGQTYAATTEIDALAPPRLDVPPLGVEALPTESIAVPQLDAIAPIAVEPLPTNDERPMTNDQRP